MSMRHIIGVFGYVVNVVSQFRYDPDSLASCSKNTEKINRIRKRERKKYGKQNTNKQINALQTSLLSLLLFTFEIERKVLIYKHLIYLLRDTESYAIRFKYPARICSILFEFNTLCKFLFLLWKKVFYLKKLQ